MISLLGSDKLKIANKSPYCGVEERDDGGVIIMMGTFLDQDDFDW